MKHSPSILGALLLAAATVFGQNSPPPTEPSAKSEPPAELKAIGAPYFAAVESVSADYQKWVAATEAWYIGELEKLQNARAKLGDLDGALAVKAERGRCAAHAATTPEQIQAMPQSLRTLRAAFDQGMKRNMDEGTRRIDVSRRKYLADLEALQKRATIAGNLDLALIVKTEKERFIAEMAAGTGSPVASAPQAPVTPTVQTAPQVPIAPATPRTSAVASVTIPINSARSSPTVGTMRSNLSSANPVAATKEKPFVNSLGMEFVPVPATRVLFCRWQTRVRDFAEFVKTRNVVSSWKMAQHDGVPVGREPEHPACSVFWGDADGFCRWLTEKESNAGKLPKGMKYRLPTDEEWSRAVGLPKEDGVTPKERNGRNQTDFPWGTDWPPKAKVGNYADESFHEKFSNAPQRWKWIEGYTDGYATTAPVGSFPANPFGIYDLGSNVSEWCEDPFDADPTIHAIRGSAWSHSASFLLLSSRRWNLGTANSCSPQVGFRCVLEIAVP